MERMKHNKLKTCFDINTVPVFAVLLLCSSISADAFNITRILNSYPNFIAFNDLLTKTKLPEAINSRRTITVLAVDNSSLAGLQDRDIDEIQRVLSAHVILDYYDQFKLKKLPEKEKTTLTTLFQASGAADGRQGFLNVIRTAGGDIVFGSAVKDAVPVAKLVRVVYAQPFNISVLQVTQPIVAPGVGEVILPPPPPPFTPPPAQPPKKSPGRSPPPPPPPSPSPSPSPSDEADAPADAPTESPDEAPVPAPAPVEAPASSPPSPTEDDGESTPSSGSSRMHLGMSVVVAALMAALINFLEF